MNEILANNLKSIITIQKSFRHYIKGKKERKKLYIQYFIKIRKIKPFVIQLIFDNSLLFKENNKRQFVLKLKEYINISSWGSVNNGSPYDEQDGTQLTQFQDNLFTCTITKKNISVIDIRLLLSKLTLDQLYKIY